MFSSSARPRLRKFKCVYRCVDSRGWSKFVQVTALSVDGANQRVGDFLDDVLGKNFALRELVEVLSLTQRSSHVINHRIG